MMRTEVAHNSLCWVSLTLYPQYGMPLIGRVQNLFGSSAVSLLFKSLTWDC